MKAVFLRTRGDLKAGVMMLALMLAGGASLLSGSANAIAAANTSPATAGPSLGTPVHVSACEQAPAQSMKDRATYSDAELARYGLPPRTPGEPFAKWAQVVRSAGKRVCDYTRWPLETWQARLLCRDMPDSHVAGTSISRNSHLARSLHQPSPCLSD